MSAQALTEVADRTVLAPDGWTVLVVEDSQIAPTAEAMANALAVSLAEEGDGAHKARVFSEARPDPALIEEIRRLPQGDIALLPLPADLAEAVSHVLDYGRGRLLGHPRGIIVTSKNGIRVLAASASSFWSWIGPRVWPLDSAANDNVPGGTTNAEEAAGTARKASRLIRVDGVLMIDLGIEETIPAEVFDHRISDDDEEPEPPIRGSQ